jgi:hypothetical protein
MPRLPPILRADYCRQVYGTVALYVSLLALAAIVIGGLIP